MNDKTKARINIATLKPWWIRLIFFILIGLPPFTKWPLNKFETTTDPFLNLALWLGYAFFIWMLIFITTKPKQFLSFLAPATLIALTTAMLGAAFIRLIPPLSGKDGQISLESISFEMTKLLIIMMAVIPYALLFVNSFSVSGIIKKTSEMAGKKKSKIVHLALAFRVFQHVGEVFTNLLLVWREENPRIIWPRFSRDWDSFWEILKCFPRWFMISIKSWCYALFIHTLKAVPFFAQELSKINKIRDSSKGDKSL